MRSNLPANKAGKFGKESKKPYALSVRLFQSNSYLFLDEFDYLCKNFRVIFCEVGQYFSVEFYLFGFKRGDKLAVSRSLEPAGCVYLDVPELAECTLLFLASAERAGPGVEQSLFGCYLLVFSSPAESFGVLKDGAALLVLNCSSFYSWHICCC